jgi:polynucleotide 5'-hydroxyl-kinase GRC3/NOL9
MLSAIAARKTRLQQAHVPSPENHSEKVKRSQKAPPTPPPSLKTSTKRRYSHQAAVNLSVKKAKKGTPSNHLEKKLDFATKFTYQDNVIFDHRDEDSDMSINLDQDDAASVRPECSPAPTNRGKKAWSPSCPVVDSSDDTSDTNEQFSADLFSSHRGPLTSEKPEVLSTYYPIREQNLFQLSLNEGSAFGLNGPAVALVLSPSATVSFVGTYRLRVLRGSISLLGTIVQPSQLLHNVFAPRSSPVPVIQALVACGESSNSLPDIPARILGVIDDGDVVILLQELQTGIEGLGNVVRTFEGAFGQIDLEGFPDIPLEGIHLVCHPPPWDISFPQKNPQVTQASRDIRAFQLPPSWEAVLSASPFSPSREAISLPRPLVLLVRGQKNSGKSTFARTLINRLCSRYVRYNQCRGHALTVSVIQIPPSCLPRK